MEWFIQIHRKILEWEWFEDEKVLKVFIYFLLKANHKDKKWRWIKIKRWEFITSLEKLAWELKLSVRNIRTVIKKLEATSEVTKEWYSNYTLIKVNNYNEYQSSDKQSDKQVTSKWQASDKQVTTTNNDNNDNNDNNIVNSIVATKVATLEEYIKENFDLEFITDIYNKHWMSKNEFQDECESFVDYWKEKSPNWKKERWQKEKTFDPKLRFRTWIKRSSKWNKQKKSNLTYKTVRI